MAAASTFPVTRGRWVLLRGLSGDGDGVVYLAAPRSGRRLHAIKTVAAKPGIGRAPGHAKEQRQVLARMRNAHLVTVTACPEIEREGGLVMEYVAGKSLAAISQRAEDYAVLLPPELGVVVAHDAFSAAASFHGFEGAGRVHGNITARTLLVTYGGETKLAGYRPGAHPPVAIEEHATRDLKSIARVLSELAFEKFPRELAVVVPRLLDDGITAEEAVAAVHAFLAEHPPSPQHRGALAMWLADVFLGERQTEALEEVRVLAAAAQRSSQRRRVAQRAFWIGGTVALLVLMGGGLSLMAHRPGEGARAMVGPGTPPAVVARSTTPPADPTLEAPVTVTAPPAVAEVALSAVATLSSTEPAPSPSPSWVSHTASRPPRRESTGRTATRLLREAESAFVTGQRVVAISLAREAARTGGGVRAHLALAEYYRSLLRHEDALRHYRAVVALEPGNQLALAGVRLLERQLAE